MTNLASLLKNEIARVARRTLKGDIDHLRKQCAAQRAAIAELRRQLLETQREFRSSLHGAHEQPSAASKAPAAVESGRRRRRFDGGSFKAKRLGLNFSANDAALLVGASALTIYNWEKGAQPRQSNLDAINDFLRLGKREAARRLEQLKAGKR